MYVVLVTDKRLGGTTAYGPYRELVKAEALAARIRNPRRPADFLYPEDFDVAAALIRKYE